MTDRDRLIRLLAKNYNCVDRNRCLNEQADHLIANGVTVNEWRPASEPPKEKGEIERLRETINEMAINDAKIGRALKQIKSEVIKEYKNKILSLFPEDQCCAIIAKSTLNIFEKEMVGESNG